MITGAETSALLGRTPIFLEGRLPLVLQVKDVLALGLRDGQIVNSTTEVRQEQLKLVLFNKVMDLPVGLKSQAGDVLTWQVQVLANGSAQLRALQSPKPPALNTPAGPASEASVGVAHSRVSQLSLRPNAGLAAWMGLFKPAFVQQLGTQMPNSPEISAWVRQWPRMGTLDGSALQQALMRSGLFTESRLLAGVGSPHADFKLMLRDWLRRVSASSEVAKQIGAALDDVESAQLQAIDAPNAREGVLQWVLGFADAPPVHVQIQREGGHKGSKKAPWLVNIHSESEHWGALWLQVKVLSEQRVALTMWAEREGIANSAQAHSQGLADEMREADLELVGFQVIHGRRTEDPEGNAPTNHGRLVDFKA